MSNTDTAISNNNKLEELINKVCPDPEIKEETWKQIDGIFNYKFTTKVLDELPEERHEEFMEIIVENPDDEEKIFNYLEKIKGVEMRKKMKEIMLGITEEITRDLIPDKETTTEIGTEGKPPIK